MTQKEAEEAAVLLYKHDNHLAPQGSNDWYKLISFAIEELRKQVEEKL